MIRLSYLLAIKFSIIGPNMYLNDEPYYMVAAEIHPQRIPYQNWDYALQLAKSFGANTISVYLIWNFYELKNHSFDYVSPQKDIAHFLRLCDDHGFAVLFRPGPYICGEWDFGGYPPYLLYERNITLRQIDDAVHKEAVQRFIFSFSPIIAPLMHYNGGPIIFVQLENEYSLYKNPQKEYLIFLKSLYESNGITGYFYTDDGNANSITNTTHLPGITIGFNGREISQEEIDFAKSIDPNVPVFVGEIHPGKQKHWGEGPWVATDVLSTLERLKQNNVGVSFYMFYGGTNFGLTAGASGDNTKQYTSHLTSYDMAAPVSEQGRVSFNFEKYRNFYNHHFGPLPDIPDPLPTQHLEQPIKISRFAGLWDQVIAIETNETPQYFERFGQNQGFIIYETTLKKGGLLILGHCSDYARAYLDGVYLATIDTNKTFKYELNIPHGGKLQILVEGMGHKAWGNINDDRKGIYDGAKLDGIEVKYWIHRRIDLEDEQFLAKMNMSDSKNLEGFYRGSFEVQQQHDIYFDMSKYGKGYLFINGFNLGRYWKIGTQQRLYCPGVFLKKGLNELVVLELMQSEAPDILTFDLAEGCLPGYQISDGICQKN